MTAGPAIESGRAIIKYINNKIVEKDETLLKLQRQKHQLDMSIK